MKQFKYRETLDSFQTEFVGKGLIFKVEQKEIGTNNKVYTFDATSLALNTIGKDIVNTAMVGVFAKVTGLVTLKSISKVLEERFGGKLAELNEKLVNEAYKIMKV